MRQSIMLVPLAFCAALATAAPARGDLIEYHEDRAGWEVAVGGAFSTADFLGFAEGPFAPDIYAELGMTIVQPPGSQYYINCCSLESFVRDGAGINGYGELELVFDASITGLALDFNGAYIAMVFQGEEYVGHTSIFGGSGHGFYGGFVSTIPFDRVVLLEPDPVPTLSIDDIHFGPPIPAPPVAALVAAGLLCRRRGRREV